VISSAPWSFAILSLAVVFVVRLFYRHRMNDLTSQLAQRNRLIEDLKPNGTAYTRLGNSTLRDRAIRLAGQIRAFYEEAETEDRLIHQSDERLGDFGSAQWAEQKRYEALQQRMARRQSEYDSRFRSDAIHLRNEILDRLPGPPTGSTRGPGGEYRSTDLVVYEDRLEYNVQLQVIAQNLDALARQLPITVPIPWWRRVLPH